MPDQNIVFFDAQCNLCNRFVQFILKKDKKNHFLYAPLQGETAKTYLEQTDIQHLKSIVVLKKGNILRKSQAVKSIMQEIHPQWNILFSIMPSAFFDFIYNFIAKNRYFLFGKKKSLDSHLSRQKQYFLP